MRQNWKAGTMSAIRDLSIYKWSKVKNRPQSTIIRIGKKMKDGSMLWQDYGTSRLYVEKAK